MVKKMICKKVSAEQLECLIGFMDSAENIVTALFGDSQLRSLRLVEIDEIKGGKAALPMPEGCDVIIRVINEYTNPDGERVLVSDRCMYRIYKCLGLVE